MADITPRLQQDVLSAVADRQPLRLHAGNSKAFFGNPVDGTPFDLSGHSGIVSHEPTELVLTARAGTPLVEIEEQLAKHGQMLSFEPPHFGGGATLGGAIASGLGGPRRP